MNETKLLALYRHWLNVEAMRDIIFGNEIPEVRSSSPTSVEEYEIFHSQYSRVSIMYALLYVVIEGFKQLKLQDPRIDELLTEESYVDLLRRFRNAVFHYQHDIFTEKEVIFLSHNDSELWIRNLYGAFELYFDKLFQVSDLLAQLMDNSD